MGNTCKCWCVLQTWSIFCTFVIVNIFLLFLFFHTLISVLYLCFSTCSTSFHLLHFILQCFFLYKQTYLADSDTAGVVVRVVVSDIQSTPRPSSGARILTFWVKTSVCPLSSIVSSSSSVTLVPAKERDGREISVFIHVLCFETLKVQIKRERPQRPSSCQWVFWETCVHVVFLYSWTIIFIINYSSFINR